MVTQFFDVADGKLAYDSSGSGPLVIAIPGMGDLRRGYRFLTPQLVAAGYRVVSLDVRGHGESSIQWPDYSVASIGQDILALVRAVDAGPALLIGNSMAAGAAIWASVEAPELVKAMVLLGPAVRGEVSSTFRLLLAALFAALGT
jgi:pimeloyl-ACP methyl ester carboxylesterase